MSRAEEFQPENMKWIKDRKNRDRIGQVEQDYRIGESRRAFAP
jgi:hypothetical protein